MYICLIVCLSVCLSVCMYTAHASRACVCVGVRMLVSTAVHVFIARCDPMHACVLHDGHAESKRSKRQRRRKSLAVLRNGEAV